MSIQVTRSQYNRMDEQISQYQQQLQQALAERDKAKSADGDRSENSALDAAEREVAAIQLQLDRAVREFRTAQVVENVDTSAVNILTQVRLRDENGAEKWYTIVDNGQGEPPSKVSVGSKMGAALLGHRVGQTVTYQDNRFRSRRLTILDIREDQ